MVLLVHLPQLELAVNILQSSIYLLLSATVHTMIPDT